MTSMKTNTFYYKDNNNNIYESFNSCLTMSYLTPITYQKFINKLRIADNIYYYFDGELWASNKRLGSTYRKGYICLENNIFTIKFGFSFYYTTSKVTVRRIPNLIANKLIKLLKKPI